MARRGGRWQFSSATMKRHISCLRKLHSSGMKSGRKPPYSSGGTYTSLWGIILHDTSLTSSHQLQCFPKDPLYNLKKVTPGKKDHSLRGQVRPCCSHLCPQGPPLPIADEQGATKVDGVAQRLSQCDNDDSVYSELFLRFCSVCLFLR